MSYDGDCEDLARSFLEDARADQEQPISDARFESLVAQLAQHIQNEIDDFITYDMAQEASSASGREQGDA